MAESRIPVDLFNPGQVFACLGFMELAEVLLGGTEAAFDWIGNSNPLFHLKANGDDDPIRDAIKFVVESDFYSISPSKLILNTSKWRVATKEVGPNDPFPFPAPSSPATLPVELSRAGVTIQVDHWGDGTVRDNVKFWAGVGGYPGAALWRDAVDSIKERAVASSSDPFSLQSRQSSSFRFDWRRDYIPLDIGFSLNEHADMAMVGYPLVELFAAIGLSHARPQRPDRWSKLLYRYGVLGVASERSELFPPAFLRAALGAHVMSFPQRFFRMNLGWPGKKNQARCVTTVTEE